ncbi:hypothetical protein [Clostridium estertheticum]|uniref:hypothetical protein n=1 Tax=Clostridium estertheticum TaxID=238834 RepID=UPI001CF5C604|nr:hypothetical protein [Clostridium estertheticum]MCB2358218.1 hypothetical protein [Clostridium estertheticum]
MNIREGNLEELDEIMSFYNMMCGELGKADFLPEGNKGGFPPKHMVINAIKHTELYRC